jgi:heme exporter protein B
MAVFRKDLAIEARTGEVVVTSGFLALLLVVLSSLSLYGGPASTRLVASGVIWLSIAFAAVLAGPP